jgi:hypothetical protein
MSVGSSKVISLLDFKKENKADFPIVVSDEAFKKLTHFTDKKVLYPYFVMCYIGGVATGSILMLILRLL